MNTIIVNNSKESRKYRYSIYLEFSKRVQHANYNKLQTNFHTV
ncbi:hypothetical protein V8G56_15390 [Gaetbulibacter aquiaggeris]|uniref:Uncharacterized protein n=1 Tax=Gaetbulibacter aquiaggeris TaxID=1735373 RepID=A0ABW7MTI1_9FLAO